MPRSSSRLGGTSIVPITAAGGATIFALTATVTDTLILGPVDGFHPAAGTKYTLFTDTGGLTGTFNTLKNPASQTHAPTYND